MSGMVGDPKEKFSCDKAQMIQDLAKQFTYITVNFHQTSILHIIYFRIVLKTLRN